MKKHKATKEAFHNLNLMLCSAPLEDRPISTMGEVGEALNIIKGALEGREASEFGIYADGTKIGEAIVRSAGPLSEAMQAWVRINGLLLELDAAMEGVIGRDRAILEAFLDSFEE